MNTNTASAAAIQEPQILTAKTYFWSSNGSASARRRAEAKRLSEVADYFRSLGMEVVENANGSVSATGTLGGKEITAYFSYSESCKNVYKNLSVTRAGKSSNITTLRKMAAAV